MAIGDTDRQTAQAVTAGYSQAWQRIRAELDRLLTDIEAARARGETIDPAWLARRNRLQALEQQLAVAIRVWVDLAERRITQAQARALLDGAADASRLLRRTLPPGLGWVPPIPDQEVAAIAMAMRVGAPLRLLLDKLGEQASQAAREALITGVALGHGPRQVARQVSRAAGIALQRALTIARTEIIGAYRRAALTRYREPRTARLLQGWTWVARLDGRTCPVCIAMHGTFHTLEESLNSHPNCRCVPVPKTISWAQLGFPDVEETTPVFEPGSDWFARQSPAFQRRVLGPGKFALYQSGDLTLDDLVQPTLNSLWGPGLKQRPLRELINVRAAPAAAEPALLDIHELRLEGPSFARQQIDTEIQAAFDTIANVHGLPKDMRGVQVREVTNVDYQGQFLPAGRPSEAGMRRTYDHHVIEMARFNESTRSTAVHEFGHYIDWELHGLRMQHMGHAGAAGQDFPFRLGTSSTETFQTSLLAGWRAAASNSRLIRELRQQIDALPDSDATRRFLNDYILTDPEIWARSYTQWIALRSGDVQLRNEIAQKRWHWSDDDFEPIAKELDDIFRRYRK